MKFETRMRRALIFVLASSLAAAAAAGAKDKEKDKPKSGSTNIDSGVFAILIGGQRVATETFSIEQKTGGSVIKSQLKENAGADAISQKSDLEITSSGELLRYEWNQASGGALTVLPQNDFLLERITTPAYNKPAEQSFLMPSTTAILDNNFFIHREVLAWRYLAAACKSEGGNLKCQKDPGEFGVLIPQDRTSMHVRLELVGKEKVTIRGAERELLRLNLTGESYVWSLWLDDHDQFKLIKVAIPADNTEVVRD